MLRDEIVGFEIVDFKFTSIGVYFNAIRKAAIRMHVFDGVITDQIISVAGNRNKAKKVVWIINRREAVFDVVTKIPGKLHRRVIAFK
ncbi:MAG: hypothetical protein BWY14_01266 [Parcubacteria group bacterium ADurb.Bin192]|nr:MAG: hypothetical protein BWY14_01266 [Parcubacteria group bacterium ADurb.Bin192]